MLNRVDCAVVVLGPAAGVSFNVVQISPKQVVAHAAN
jgi:hypothetical protein